MKLVHVEAIGVYGSFGCVVIARDEDRAKEIYLNAHPGDKKYELSVTTLAEDLTKEFIQDEVIW